jgi:signal transduction histidine kinase
MIAREMRRSGIVLVAASAVVALGLVGVVAVDYAATRRELVGLLRAHAGALRETVAAAARSNRLAGALAETQLAERLRDQARLLAELDREGNLTTEALGAVARRHPLFRVSVFAADGSRTYPDATSEEAGPGGRGPRGGFGAGRGRAAGGGEPGRGPGAGFGGRGGGGVVRQILEEGQDEVVTGLHEPRWGGSERLAAGVRRPRGGAIVVTVDAGAIASLQKPSSLESLLEEVTRSSPEIAYTVFEHDDERLAFGDAPKDAYPEPGPPERELTVEGRPVLDIATDVPLPGGSSARLRLGMRLDDLRRVERRMGLRLLASVLAASALVALAFGLSGLRRRYGVLSAMHARAEEALRRRDRLAAMGELASTVAHEVRNPLNAVAMTAQRLRREFLDAPPAGEPDRGELEELLAVMAAETRRIDRIVQQFLDYARPPRLRPEPVDLDALVVSLVERTRPLAAARGVSLEVGEGGAGEARVDAGQLGQALDNLLRNAIEATPVGGVVTVSARRDRDGRSIEVRDTGAGIAPDALPRIFDLYFTTRAEGTGVGLAVTQQIVTAHGGTIEVESRVGEGTCMIVRLPNAAGGESA